MLTVIVEGENLMKEGVSKKDVAEGGSWQCYLGVVGRIIISMGDCTPFRGK